MFRRTYTIVAFIIGMVLLVGVAVLVHNDIKRNGFNLSVNQNPDLNNKEYAVLLPDPSSDNIDWLLSTIFTFRIKSNSPVITLEIEQTQNNLHIVTEYTNQECPGDGAEFLTKYNYYDSDVVKILACADIESEYYPVIKLKDNNNVLSSYTIESIGSDGSVVSNPAPLIDFDSFDADIPVPDNIIASVSDGNIVLKWPSKSNTIRYEVARRHCTGSICTDWKFIGNAYDTELNIVEFVDNNIESSDEYNLFQYKIRTVAPSGFSEFSSVIESVSRIFILTEGYLLDNVGHEIDDIIGSDGIDIDAWTKMIWYTHDNTFDLSGADDVDPDSEREYLIYKSVNDSEYYIINNTNNFQIYDLHISPAQNIYCYKIQIKNGDNYGLPWPQDGICGSFEQLSLLDLDQLSSDDVAILQKILLNKPVPTPVAP